MQNETRARVEFAVAYPVIEKKRTALRICTSNGLHWVKRSHVTLVEDSRQIELSSGAAATASRAMVKFWRSRERLGSFYSGADVGKAPPDYEERAEGSGPSAAFPVSGEDFVEMSIGGRQIEIANVLVPFSRKAVVAYGGERAAFTAGETVGALAFQETFDAFREEGFMAVIPVAPDAEEVLATHPAFAARSDWFTAALWVTVDGDILSFADTTEDAEPAVTFITADETKPAPLKDMLATRIREVEESLAENAARDESAPSATTPDTEPKTAAVVEKETDAEPETIAEKRTVAEEESSTEKTDRMNDGEVEPDSPERVAAVDMLPSNPCHGPGRRPMRREDEEALERRALSLPGIVLHDRPDGDVVDTTLSALGIYYVYCEKKDDGWVEIGSSAFGETLGWVRADKLEDWRNMVVMRFTPRGGNRERVLFFREEADLAGVVADPYAGDTAIQFYDDIKAGEHDPDIFVSMEPATPTAFGDRPFMMPVLDWQFEMFDDGEETTLIRIAGVNMKESAPEVETIDRRASRDVGRMQGALRDFRFGIKFVIDTTKSMQDYIDLTRRAVRHFYETFETGGELKSVSFGLLGYRDTLSQDDQVEYVTRPFQKLSRSQDPSEVLVNMEKAEAATASTPGFSEDAFSALYEAITDDDWEGIDGRAIIHITDAAARSDDDLMLYNNIDENTVGLLADQKDIFIFPIHLITPEAEKAGNVSIARMQYGITGQTGDPSESKYTPIPTGDLGLFDKRIKALADTVFEQLRSAKGGKLADIDGARQELQAAEAEGGEREREARFNYALVNEIFRSQLEFLGRKRGETPPRFYRAWASDRDLVDPRVVSLEARVFLTRNQLSELAQTVEDIVGTSGRVRDPSEFFDELRALAARTAVEGGRAGRNAETIGRLIPAFVASLPYRSKVLRMTERRWLALGNTGREQFIGELRRKLGSYRDLEGDADQWLDIGAGDSALEVTPVAMDLLP